ncbi:MAG: cysteine--tRNA ligase [Actinobacteria bacterium]|nr:cysteine--tRNA ligase [Actinomycetota bacterium]
MMRLFDTAAGEVVPFAPGRVATMYTCGITPYDSAHLGHAAVYLACDVLQRRLRDLGHSTRCVRNVTDVDDDILRKARELGVHYLDLAAEEMARFDADMKALNLLPAYAEPRATSAIPEILSLVDALVSSGHAYAGAGAVYFDVSSAPNFGHLSRLGREEMLALAAERGGNPEDPAKRDPLDFVLWQPAAPDEPSWESRFGPGRPGWHIECSALAMRELGPTVDLHGGGSDLVFPHHECEAAQSEAVTGKPLARHWFHVGMVGLGGRKMSKSLGNLVFVGDLLEDWEPDAVRLAVLAQHYRSGWEFDPAALDLASARLDRWRGAGKGSAGLEDVRRLLDDDLDTPGAIEALDAASASGGVSAGAALLGVETAYSSEPGRRPTGRG